MKVSRNLERWHTRCLGDLTHDHGEALQEEQRIAVVSDLADELTFVFGKLG